MERTDTPLFEPALVLDEKEVKLLHDYFMTAGFITYEIDGLHAVINKIIRHCDDNELARRANSSA